MGKAASPETLERALYEWPDWRDSIHEGRKKFNVRPNMSWEELNEWKKAYGGEAFTDYAVEEMKRLGLHREFSYYWMCCVLSDFEKPDGTVDFNAIRDFVVWTRPKVYPAFFATVTLPPRVMADEESHNLLPEFPTFKIEGSLQLVAKEDLERAVRHVMRARNIVLKQAPHPLSKYIPKGRERVKAETREWKAKIEKFRDGKTTFTDLVREEYFSEEVQQQLARSRQNSPYRVFVEEERNKRKTIRDKWDKRLKRAGLKPGKIERNWWKDNPDP